MYAVFMVSLCPPGADGKHFAERNVTCMFIVIGILVSLLFTAVEILVFDKEKKIGSKIGTGLKNAWMVPLFSIAVLKYILGYPHFLQTNTYRLWDFVLFTAICLVMGLLILVLRRWLETKQAKWKQEAPKSRGVLAVKIAAVLVFLLGCLCFFMTLWSKSEYGDLPADQMIFLLFSPVVGSPSVDFISAFEGPVFLSFLLTTLFAVFAFSHFRLTFQRKNGRQLVIADYGHRIISLILAGILLVSGVIYGACEFHFLTIVNTYFSSSNIIDANYVDPRDANLQFPEKKRNLIHIYLESMENSYLSKEQGGFMDVDMIPELSQLAQEGYNFSHLDHQIGGPNVAVGTTWSVASMVNMSTGLPMKAPNDPNAYGTPGNFLPGACALGDILKEQGYEQTLMFGADADFGGLSYFYQNHGDFKIMDYKYAKDTGMIPKNYLVWWGYEDDKLFEFAKEELTRLSQTGKPFNFTMETADTHRPDGYLSPKAPTPHENQYANVVSYSSSEVYKFVRWIQEQPFYEDTTIVIMGDHLSMETNFFEFYDFDEDYQRSQYMVILNPDPSVATRDENILFNRLYANFDMFPTILSSMGVQYDGSRLGIGTDLFSGEKTLFEEYGCEYVNEELEKGSVLFNTQILVGNREDAKKSK